MKLSLAMIAKGTAEEAAHLEKSLKSVEGVFDEIVLVANLSDPSKIDPIFDKIAKDYKATLYKEKWNGDFSEMRNLSFERCTGDIIFWMDADDIIDKPKKLREVAEAMPLEVDAVTMNYKYDVDEYGNTKTEHIKERFIRNNGVFRWHKRIHENLEPSRRANTATCDEFEVIHATTEQRSDESILRNIELLELELKDEGADPDPRTMFYLAACYVDAGQLERALELYQLYLQLSGWDQERSQAWCMIGGIYKKLDKEKEAKDAYLQAIIEDEDNKQPYASIAEIYYNNKKYEKAIKWVELCLRRPERKTTVVTNPLQVTYLPLIIYADSKFNLGEIPEAIKYAEAAYKIRPDKLTKEMLETYKKVNGHQLAATAIADLAKFLEVTGEKSKARILLNKVVPKDLQDNPFLLNIRKHYFKPKKWPEKSVVIFTGDCIIGGWGPWSLKTGIGGSEEAIIRLSKRLTEQGYQVTVYSMPGAKAGEYDGVTWKNYWEFDGRDEFDVLVGWRNPWMFDTKYNARKSYLWLHDVMPEGEFTEERLNNLDKVLVLSNYHRSLFPNIPDNKIWLSANGIDGEEFDGSETHERNLHSIIFASSHVRGLPHILEIWPDVKKAVPDAEFHFYYGRDSYVAVHKDNPERLEWLEKQEQLMEELDGVYDHGRVSQAEIAEATMSCGIWAYPCPFPEISCITAMKSQAGGAVPVASNFAALNETIQYGVKMPMLDDNGVGVWNEEIRDKYKEALIDMLKDTDKQESIRKEMIPWAKKNFSWTQVAKDWITEFEK